MSREEQIDALLEEILNSDRPAEEVCSGHPELLPEVRERLQRVRAIAQQVDSLFPISTGRTQTSQYVPLNMEATLPQIPDYVVESVLGRGGMGIVYKAHHVRLNRDVALKMLLTGSYASRQENLRFVREAESVAALKHPNIVQIYEFGEVDGHPFYTMEFIGGGSLAEKLAGAAQPARDSAKIVGALARAVQSAHESGILHRDLKPANILLANGDGPKIADFGLARRWDQDSDLTHTGARVGTPSYMAPEQMLGRSATLGPAVDVFALGAILYEMLTGRPPFRGDSLSDTERKLATEDPALPSKVNSKVPRDLETICLKCLEKSPSNRYASAGELADDLDRFLRHEPIHARPISKIERGWRWVRRNPLPTALAISMIVVIGLLGSRAMQEWADDAAAQAEKARLTSRLESGIELVQKGHFAEASALLDKLGDGGFEDLRQRIDRALSDLNLAEKLEATSVKRATALDATDATWRPNERAAAEYAALFRDAGYGTVGDNPIATAKRIDESDVDAPLIATLDDWAVCEVDEARRQWILEVARRAGTNADDWKKRSRDPNAWADAEALSALAKTIPIARLPVQELRAFGDRMAAAGLEATAFRRRVQQEHIDNFLANLSLADALRPADPAEAIRYYQAALAIHPQSTTAYNNLAVALAHLGRSGEAVAAFEQSIRLDPASAAGQYNLGLALSKQRPDEAIEHLQKAIEINPTLAIAHRTLGEVYLDDRDFARAEAALQTGLPLVQIADEREAILGLIRRCKAEQ